MRNAAEGLLNERISIVGGNSVYPAYLLACSKRNVMVEAGLNFLGPAYLEGVTSFWGQASDLDLLAVTHGHYEHMGAAPFMKRKIPDLELRAHETIPGLLEKNKIVTTMNMLSDQIKAYFGREGEETPEEQKIGIVPFGEPLRDGDVLDLGDCSLQVIATPGHTRDHLSFFIPEWGVLFPGEALGNPIMETEDEVKIEFLSSYTDYLQSMEILLALEPKVTVIAMSHLYYYDGEDVGRFMELALRDTIHYRELIEGYLDRENGDIERAVQTMVRIEYDEKKKVYQERNAYLMNVSAQVRAVAAVR